MSTDIHPHIEIKVNGKWEHYSRPHRYELQHYDMFGKMAGVRRNRDQITPICEPKGFPEDASVVTRIDYEWMGEDANCASWFNLDEIRQLSEWYATEGHIGHRGPLFRDLEDLFGYLFGNTLDGFTEYPENYPDCIQDVRLVFWFNN